MLACSCPQTTIDTVPFDPCEDIFSKAARMYIQVHDDANNLFVNGANGIELESSWTARTTATDDTKIVVTPRLEEVTFNTVDRLEDSENFDGAPFYITSGPQLVTAVMRNVTPAQFDALKNLECRNQALSFYMVDKNNKIGARQIGNDHAGIIISPKTFGLLDPERAGGLVDQFKVTVGFYLPSGWYSSFDIVTPETGFTPLTEIKP